MNVLRARTDLRNYAPKKVCLAIGVFDGVHLGHQQVIRQTVSDAQHHEAHACVITFDCHPASIVAPDRAPPLIYSLPQKLRAIESLGAESVWLIHFDKAFSRLSGEEFIQNVVHDFNSIESICVGGNFTFGHKRSGNVPLLKILGSQHGFTVHGLAAVSLDNQTVSSTRVRQAIRAGKLDQASEMLGRSYSLAGTVIPGDQLGAKLGFPTANLDVPGLILPPHGVYAVHAHHQNQTHRAVLNIGIRPTLTQTTPRLRVEAHILSPTNDLYGQELEVTFVAKLRDEMKFPSISALRIQIASDIEHAHTLFNRGEPTPQPPED